MSKITKFPFCASNNRSIEPLNKVHCDVSGSAPINSLQGFRHYAIFIDDFQGLVGSTL